MKGFKDVPLANFLKAHNSLRAGFIDGFKYYGKLRVAGNVIYAHFRKDKPSFKE